MKKVLAILSVFAVLCFCAVPAFAANAGKAPDVQVEITAPAAIDSVPVHDDKLTIAVTNSGDTTLHHLGCYLTVVDVGRGQTYPADEFGENAYQTRTIDALAPGEHTMVEIPVHILYVGQFRFTASVIDFETNQVFTGNALDVTMNAVSHLNKNLVMTVAGIVPVVLAASAVLLTQGKTKRKE